MSAEPHRSTPRVVPGNVRGLLFDMGNTLYDATLWGRWLWQLLARLGVDCTLATLFDLWDREYLGPAQRGECSYQQALRALLLRLGLSSAQVDEVEAASLARRRELESDARPLPHVRSTLTRLKQAGLVLGVLSDDDRTGDKLRSQLDAMRIGPLLSVVITSCDLGRTLPDAVCYTQALSALQLSAQHVLYVGHDAGKLAGARAAGMLTAAFNCPRTMLADAHLARFDELLACLPDRHRTGWPLQGAA